MASQPGKLTPQQKEIAVRWLAERGAGSTTCPACGNSGWSIADQLVFTSVYVHGVGVLAGEGFPAVLVICNRCGFLRSHSAAMMGLLG